MPRDRRLGAFALAPADGRGVVDDLPLQIGQRNRVVIDDAERADAGGGEIFEHRRAEPAGADHQHPRALQPLLPRTADLRQHDVARVALQFFVGEGGAVMAGPYSVPESLAGTDLSGCAVQVSRTVP